MNKIIKECENYLEENKCKLNQFCNPMILLKYRPELMQQLKTKKGVEIMCWDVKWRTK